MEVEMEKMERMKITPEMVNIGNFPRKFPNTFLIKLIKISPLFSPETRFWIEFECEFSIFPLAVNRERI